MSTIYYKTPITNDFTQLTYQDFGAAPRDHKHQGDSIGFIPAEKGGLFDDTYGITDLKFFTGPIIYNKYNQLQQDYILQDGVYFANGKNDSYIQIGMPGWEQGAIPYKTEKEQLENMYRQLPLNSTLYIPKAICAGMLNSEGTAFCCTLRIYYLIPEGTKSISISGQYIIRQNGCYLFTSGDNYYEHGWAEPFVDKPSMIASSQTIVDSTTTGFFVRWDNTDEQKTITPSVTDNKFTRNSNFLRLDRVVSTAVSSPQTTTYNFKHPNWNNGNIKSAQGVGWMSGTCTFSNLKLTFNDT